MLVGFKVLKLSSPIIKHFLLDKQIVCKVSSDLSKNSRFERLGGLYIIPTIKFCVSIHTFSIMSSFKSSLSLKLCSAFINNPTPAPLENSRLLFTGRYKRSDRIYSDRQSGSDQLGSSRIMKKPKIK